MQNLESLDQIEQENVKRIKQMDEDEIQRSLNEIYERLGKNKINLIAILTIFRSKNNWISSQSVHK